MNLNRSYSEMIRLPTFVERFEYLKLGGIVGDSTFGFNRYLNQELYCSSEWRSIRNRVILRDSGCDLAILDRMIGKYILIHHINPLSEDDIVNRSPVIFDMENLVCVSKATHNAIHYGDSSLILKDPIARKPNDTCPWR